MNKKEIEKKFGALVEVNLIEITPAMAQKWMSEKNTHNRPLYRAVVEQYCADMKNGFWALNHQGICFDTDGTLSDGQHRLQAIIESGKTIAMYVFRNMPKKYGSKGNEGYTQDTIDDIKKRTIGDKLHLSYGVSNGNTKAATCGIIAYICHGYSRRQSTRTTWKIYELYQSEVDMVIANKASVPGLMVAPVVGSFAFVAKVYPEKVLDFELKYFSGTELLPNDPILKFREYMRDSAKKGTHRRPRTRAVIMKYALSALMHHVLGNKIKGLKVSDGAIDFFINKQKKFVDEVKELGQI